MSFRFSCRCGAALEAAAALRGRRVRCPACREILFAEVVAIPEARLVDPAPARPLPADNSRVASPGVAWGMFWTGWFGLWATLIHGAAQTGQGAHSLLAIGLAAGSSLIPLSAFLIEVAPGVLRRIAPLVACGAVLIATLAVCETPSEPRVSHISPNRAVISCDHCLGWLEWEARLVSQGRADSEDVCRWGDARCGEGAIVLVRNAGRTVLRCRVHNEQVPVELRAALIGEPVQPVR
ncbi:MAG: hypothetical protein K8T20_20595 [Planctomycetes bacterium]|nr:hypothetical protein [Planctomycetota bacterium]